MVRIMKKDGNRLEGIGERIAVRLTLLEEALGMTPGDPEIYGNWIASKDTSGKYKGKLVSNTLTVR